uniref:Related to COX19-Cytochrome c oxidase assembly protein n=1 Tax=Melanopsichium pennsylvanicum 4 TaxID=1398559 RepID=A0A077R695_9BASI|nr:related to COX19-Cytochrome c oxidase assembly protein [Melanopsichium pennsylvanicum 4]
MSNGQNVGTSSVEPNPNPSCTTNAAADRVISQGGRAHSGSTPSYAGDTHGAEGNVTSAKAGSGSPADETNRGSGAGRGNSKGYVSRQAGSYAGDSHGRSGNGRLV